MTTIVFNDKELIFDDSLLELIPYFNSMNKHGFKESEDKMVSLDCDSNTFLLMIKYKIPEPEHDKEQDKKMLDLCDYLCLDDVKENYFNSYDICYLLKNNMDFKIKYIIQIIKKHRRLVHFKDEKHFQKFMKSPEKTEYYVNNYDVDKTSILIYLMYKKYNLLERFIKNGLFDAIDANSIHFYHFSKKESGFVSMLIFACTYSRTLSSNKYVKILLDHPEVNINQYSYEDETALMAAKRTMNTTSMNKTVKMLLNHPKNKVDT
jgi:hypothetical protein